MKPFSTRTAAALAFAAMFLVGACSEPPPPRSVTEFLDNPILLEAAVVRCAQNRSETRYDAECVNARQAVSIIEAREERERARAFEEQSQKKREALRRTQAAAAEARRRAAEARRLREEAEYLAQFGEVPETGQQGSVEDGLSGNAPTAAIPSAPPRTTEDPLAPVESTTGAAGANAPQASSSSPPADLGAIREELKKRAESETD